MSNTLLAATDESSEFRVSKSKQSLRMWRDVSSDKHAIYLLPINGQNNSKNNNINNKQATRHPF